jgi:hypothetical protein
MADRTWYVALQGKREGPFTEAQFREQIARGQVGSETLVWCETMTAWTKAGDVPGLLGGGLVHAQQAMVPGLPGTLGGPLHAVVGTWALFGRSLLVALCQFLIIPSPWAVTAFYRWLVPRIQLPNSKPVTFEGKPGDIWYIFILSAACGYGGFIHSGVTFLLVPLTTLFYLITTRWFFANLNWEGRTAPLRFTGGYWGLLGWTVFAWLAFLTIIGWAWVFTATLRWLCLHVEGSSKQLTFEGTGWGVLWRTLVMGLCFALIIPIPWIFAWYTRWMFAQFHLSDRA